MISDDDNDLDDYEVGYGRPPKEHQFKPGHSGNRSGRPKRSLNLKTDLTAELKSRIQLTENGKRVSLTRQQVILKQLVAKAAKGDVRAADHVIRLVAATIGLDPVDPKAGKLSDNDDAVLRDFIAFYGSGSEATAGGDVSGRGKTGTSRSVSDPGGSDT